MNGQQHQSSQDSRSNVHERPLVIDDLIQYLSQLASLNGDYRTGNQELSKSLRQLAKALLPYSDRTISEFVDHIKGMPGRRQASSRLDKTALPRSLESVSQQEIEEILGNDNYTKSQIIEVGIRRFGIPRSRLERSNKQDVLNLIYAALNHEKSLDVISKEASRGVRAS